MKKSSFVSLTLLSVLTLTSCNKYERLLQKGDADVYLILGQSNAAGFTKYEPLLFKDKEAYVKYSKPNENVLISGSISARTYDDFEPIKFGFGDTKEHFGPEIGISEKIQSSEKRKYIIKATYGGTSLNHDWLTNGEKSSYYNIGIPYILGRLDYLKSKHVKPHIKGIFWMQGESDSFYEEDYSIYNENTLKLLNYLKDDLKNYYTDHFNFVDATIKERDDTWTYAKKINKSKIELANELENYYVVLTNDEDETALDLTTKNQTGEEDDHAHYDSLSMLKLGYAAGELLIK